MDTDFIYLDATEIAELIRTGKASSAEVVQAHLDRIEAVDSKTNAVVTLADGAMDAARAADEKLAAGAEVGPLHGVPVTVKDGFDTAGVLTQRGSPIFAGRIPDTDATAVTPVAAASQVMELKSADLVSSTGSDLSYHSGTGYETAAGGFYIVEYRLLILGGSLA